MKKLLKITLGLMVPVLIAAAVMAAGQQGGSPAPEAPQEATAQPREGGAPGERFVPSREIGADRAVDFPADI